MYILNATIENIRSIRHFKLEFKPEECPGWHVLIGDNGSGKTSVVRSLAVGLLGPSRAMALWEDWSKWYGGDGKTASIELKISRDEELDEVDDDHEWETPESDTFTTQLVIASVRSKNREVEFTSLAESKGPNHVGVHFPRGYRDPSPAPPDDYLQSGWFSASFGPFRRFLGGDSKYDELFESQPRLAGHLSAFGEDVALTHTLSWIRDLRFKQLEAKQKEDEGLLGDVRRFINDGKLLPHDTTLQEVTSDEVVFRDGNGCKVDINQLSDGYRSVLSLTFELIRQLVRAYGREKVFVREGESVRPQIELPGVVIVDEIDAHLHPTWQRRIGKWFTKRFPQLQFIVTTHSPLVCQAAAEGGSVWRLPTPGVENDGGRITGTELKRLTLGNVLEAYGTEAFGGDVNRSELSQQKMKRLAQLNQKALRQSLDDTEQQEQLDLRSALPTSAGTLDTTGGEAR